jgi:hypothetical protein
MIKKAGLLGLPKTENSLVNQAIERFETKLIIEGELRNLLEIAEIYEIDLLTVNGPGIDLALCLARQHIKGFTPSADSRGNPRDAAELHRDLRASIDADLKNRFNLNEAIKRYRKKMPNDVKMDERQIENAYHKSRRALVDQEKRNVENRAIIKEIIKKHFSK